MQESCKILARNIFSVRFLQEMYFLPESCKICIFCQDLARILQELYLFSTRVYRSRTCITIEFLGGKRLQIFENVFRLNYAFDSMFPVFCRNLEKDPLSLGKKSSPKIISNFPSPRLNAWSRMGYIDGFYLLVIEVLFQRKFGQTRPDGQHGFAPGGQKRSSGVCHLLDGKGMLQPLLSGLVHLLKNVIKSLG